MICSCGLVVNNLKEKTLPPQMSRNRFDLILARRYCNCFTKENLKVPAVNEMILKQCGAARKLFLD